VRLPLWLYWPLWHVINALVWLATGWRVAGREHVPRTGPLLVVCNHLHNADPFLISVAVNRPICYMAKVELFRVPLLGWIIDLFGAFPIARGAADRQAIKTALELVEAGCAVGVFPEGTRSRSGSMKRGLAGIGLLAARSRAPILPVAIAGSERALRLWPRPTVRVTIGRPLELAETRLAGRHYQAIVDEIMTEIARLLPPAYRGYYAAAASGAPGAIPDGPVALPAAADDGRGDGPGRRR
jgi:1-acyl-sn-glycerol-3-phosphate acyltransferase